MMKIDVKPLVHWAIYKGYKLRFRSRTPELVAGVLTDADGSEVSFEYLPDARVLQAGDQRIRMNEYGWEVERWTAA
jgi:hypothetical protein